MCRNFIVVFFANARKGEKVNFFTAFSFDFITV